MKRPADHYAGGLASLGRFVAIRPQRQVCEMCAHEIAEEHRHLIETQTRKLVCVCDACSILFDHDAATAYRRLSHDVRELAGLTIPDSLWNSLGIPAGLLFLIRSARSIGLFYPSPAGPTQAVLDDNVWLEISAAHPAIASMKVEVDALLINRVKGSREYFIVPVDECYRLTAIVRRHWRGFSGGDEAWERIGAFFNTLRERSYVEGRACHA